MRKFLRRHMTNNPKNDREQRWSSGPSSYHQGFTGSNFRSASHFGDGQQLAIFRLLITPGPNVTSCGAMSLLVSGSMLQSVRPLSSVQWTLVGRVPSTALRLQACCNKSREMEKLQLLGIVTDRFRKRMVHGFIFRAGHFRGHMSYLMDSGTSSYA